jgi:hypothetical protein
MSERARVLRRMLLACALVAGGIGFARPVRAQSEVDQLRARAETARVRSAAATAAYRTASARARLSRSDTIRAAGIDLVVVPRLGSELDNQRLAEGLERGRSLLRQQWGSASDALVDTTSWRLYSSQRRFASLQPLTLASGQGGRRTSIEIRRPVDPSRVERFLLRHAGVNVTRAIPALEGFAGADLPLEEPDQAYQLAARELALSWSSPARRCYAGSIADCRRILTRAHGQARLDTWYDPADHRAVATSHAGDIAKTDTVRHRLRNRCNDGEDAACTELARSFAEARFPLSTNPRATFVTHALWRADSSALVRLRAAPSEGTPDVVALLSAATGVSEDSLLAGWQARTNDALARSRPPAFPLIAGTAVWGLILLGISTRRRPS